MMNDYTHSDRHTPQIGRLTKMAVNLSHQPFNFTGIEISPQWESISETDPSPQYVDYTLKLLDTEGGEGIVTAHMPLGWYLNREMHIEFLGKISCITCGKRIKKTYGDGHCYPCFMDAPSAAECVIRPALCLAHKGQGRDLEWELKNHAQPHLVYLALSNKYKVGVTRDWPTRWVDQGAADIQVIAETPYRQLAGQIELFLSQHYSDRTSWQRMLKGEVLQGADLEAEVQRAQALLPSELSIYSEVKHTSLYLNYPIIKSISRVKSIKLDKVSSHQGRLLGARGQYLIFDGGTVVNLRAHTGYHVKISAID